MNNEAENIRFDVVANGSTWAAQEIIRLRKIEAKQKQAVLSYLSTVHPKDWTQEDKDLAAVFGLYSYEFS